MASRVQSKNSTDSDTATIAFDSNVTAGNLGLVFTRCGGTSQNASVTDTRSSSWALAQRVISLTDFRVELWWTVFASTGACTITMGGGAIGRVQAEEVTGLGAGATLDQQNGTNGTSTTPASGTITTTAAAWVASALGVKSYPSVQVTPGSGWTLIYNGGNKYGGEDRDEAAPGTFNGAWTLPESNDWGSVVAAFKAAAATAFTSGVVSNIEQRIMTGFAA